MKITIESDYGKYQVEELGKDQDIFEMMELICQVLLAQGFHPNSIKDGFISKVEEYEEIK